MRISLARIDDRLIHGQVATVWAKHADADRIIVVSEEVNNDDIRKTLVKQAAPPGVKVNIVDAEKAIKVYNNPKYEDETVFYLFTHPQEVLQMVEAGVPITSINIGGMQYQDGRVQVTKAVSVSVDEAADLRKLKSLGVDLDCRVVAADSAIDFEEKLAEIGL